MKQVCTEFERVIDQNLIMFSLADTVCLVPWLKSDKRVYSHLSCLQYISEV
jgi:hypothetical protein